MSPSNPPVVLVTSSNWGRADVHSTVAQAGGRVLSEGWDQGGYRYDIQTPSRGVSEQLERALPSLPGYESMFAASRELSRRAAAANPRKSNPMRKNYLVPGRDDPSKKARRLLGHLTYTSGGAFREWQRKALSAIAQAEATGKIAISKDNGFWLITKQHAREMEEEGQDFYYLAVHKGKLVTIPARRENPGRRNPMSNVDYKDTGEILREIGEQLIDNQDISNIEKLNLVKELLEICVDISNEVADDTDDDNAKAYFVDHLTILSTEEHGFMSRDFNIDKWIKRLEKAEEGDEDEG